MLKRPDRVNALLRREQGRTAVSDAERFAQGLAIFAALWREAESLGKLTHERWQDDIEPDLAIARAIDGRAESG